MTRPLRTIPYTLCNPTGNITLLAEAPVPAEEQPAIARRLMEREPETEQVGFVRFPDTEGGCDVRLRMAGGEFCGNATLSAAMLFLERRGRREGSLTLHVSGADAPVPVTLKKTEDGGFRGTVTMPKPASAGMLRLLPDREFPVVRFPGIAHVVLEAGDTGGVGPADAEALARRFCRELSADALGLMFLNAEEGILRPLVYVPAADTMFWESSCASGSAAAAVWTAERTGGAVNLALRQPGGTLQVSAVPGGKCLLTGTVSVMRSGELEMPDSRTSERA